MALSSSAFLVLISLISFAYSQDDTYIRFVNAVYYQNVTITTNVEGVSYDLAFTQVSDYIPASAANGLLSVTISINGTALTSPRALHYASPYTLIVIMLDHNNVLNLIGFNETLADSMVSNNSTDGSMPARSWVRLVGLNGVDPTRLISLNNTDTNTVLFDHVAFLQDTPYVEISSHTTQLLAYVSTDSSITFPLSVNLANSTAYTVFYFPDLVTITGDRYVPFTVTVSTTSFVNPIIPGDDSSASSPSGGKTGSVGSGDQSSGSSSGSGSGSGSVSGSGAVSGLGDSGNPGSVSNVNGVTSSASKVVVGCVLVFILALLL